MVHHLAAREVPPQTETELVPKAVLDPAAANCDAGCLYRGCWHCSHLPCRFVLTSALAPFTPRHASF